MGFWAVDGSGAGWAPVRPDKWDWRDGYVLRSLGPESPVVGCRIRSAEALASTKEDRGADETIMNAARFTDSSRCSTSFSFLVAADAPNGCA